MTYDDMKSRPAFKTALFGLILLLQVGVLSGMTVKKMLPVWFGRRVIFKPVPRDPNDLFRGQFVRLEYPFERIALHKDDFLRDDSASATLRGSAAGPARPVELVPNPRLEDWRTGRRIYALLERFGTGEADWQAVYVGFEPRAAGTGQILLRGKVRYCSPDYSLELAFGLDAYYVTEGDGPKIEGAMRRRDDAGPVPPVTVEVYVDGSGASTLTGLFVGGERF